MTSYRLGNVFNEYLDNKGLYVLAGGCRLLAQSDFDLSAQGKLEVHRSHSTEQLLA
ncbi:MAG: hypothetical protein AB7U73_14420 [Pirellulales bacterium]